MLSRRKQSTCFEGVSFHRPADRSERDPVNEVGKQQPPTMEPCNIKIPYLSDF